MMMLTVVARLESDMSATVTVMFCGAAVAITHRDRQVVAGHRFRNERTSVVMTPLLAILNLLLPVPEVNNRCCSSGRWR